MRCEYCGNRDRSQIYIEGEMLYCLRCHHKNVYVPEPGDLEMTEDGTSAGTPDESPKGEA